MMNKCRKWIFIQGARAIAALTEPAWRSDGTLMPSRKRVIFSGKA